MRHESDGHSASLVRPEAFSRGARRLRLVELQQTASIIFAGILFLFLNRTQSHGLHFLYVTLNLLYVGGTWPRAAKATGCRQVSMEGVR